MPWVMIALWVRPPSARAVRAAKRGVSECGEECGEGRGWDVPSPRMQARVESFMVAVVVMVVVVVLLNLLYDDGL